MIKSQNTLKRKNAELMRYEFDNNINRVRSYPLTIGMAANKTCNVNCIFCLAGSRSKEKIAWDQFSSMENVFNHVGEVIFSGEEVILHPDIWKMFALLSKKGVFTSFFSNGKALKPEVMESLVEHRVGRIACSFHGAIPETYNSIVRGADFNTIVQQFEYLERLRARIEKRTGEMCMPYLVFHYVMMRRNVEELPRFLELASRLGAQTVIAKFMLVYPHLKHLTNESLFFYPELTNKTIEHCISKAKGMPLTFVSPKKFVSRTSNNDYNSVGDPQREYAKCSWPWRQCNIDVNGNVTPCCGGAPIMGNIYERPFEEIWNNEKYVDLRATVNTPNRWPECRKCHDVATASDSDNIRRHILFLKENEKIKTETINSIGIFTKDEKLYFIFSEILNKIKAGDSKTKYHFEKLSDLISLEERLYLSSKYENLTKNNITFSKNAILLLFIFRFLNNFGYVYIAHRLFHDLIETGLENYFTKQSSIYTYQLNLEEICSQFTIGYYTDGIENFKRSLPWVKEYIGEEDTQNLINLIIDYDWKQVRKHLNGILKKRLYINLVNVQGNISTQRRARV